MLSGTVPLPRSLELYAETTCQFVTPCNGVVYAVERIAVNAAGVTERAALFEGGDEPASLPFVLRAAFVADASRIALTVCEVDCASPHELGTSTSVLVSSDRGASWEALADSRRGEWVAGFDARLRPLLGNSAGLLRAVEEEPFRPPDRTAGGPWPLATGELAWAHYDGRIVADDGATWLDLGLRDNVSVIAVVGDVVPSPGGNLYAVRWSEEVLPRGSARPRVYLTIATAEGQLVRTSRYDRGVLSIVWTDEGTLVANIVAPSSEGAPSGLPRDLWLPALIDATSGEARLIEGPFVEPSDGVQPSDRWLRIRAARIVP